MNEEIPFAAIVAGALSVLYVGYELEKRRDRLRKIFNVFDKDESVVGDALESLLKSGQLTPYSATA